MFSLCARQQRQKHVHSFRLWETFGFNRSFVSEGVILSESLTMRTSRPDDEVDTKSDESLESEPDNDNWEDATFPVHNGSMEHGLWLRFVSPHVQCGRNENIELVFLWSFFYSILPQRHHFQANLTTITGLM